MPECDKILIVVNNPLWREELQALLWLQGYRTQTASNGHDAFAYLKKDDFSLVLLDHDTNRHEMNQVDGFHLMARMAQENLNTLVIIMDGQGSTDTAIKAFRNGVYDYLKKPCAPEEVLISVKKALTYRRQINTLTHRQPMSATNYLSPHVPKKKPYYIAQEQRMGAQLRDARQKEALVTLAGGIAHQFNNALSVVTGNIDLLEMDAKDTGKATIYKAAIRDAANRMKQLTAQLLAYAKKGNYNSKTVSLSDFVRNTLPLVKNSIHSGIHVDTYLPTGMPLATIDLSQMEMALAAVLKNASEAMPAGEGCIRITCTKKIITMANARKFPGLKPGPYICLSISDNGSGMDGETRRRIFEPFFSTKFVGRGLSMPAVYGFVKNHSGYISVDSESGMGTTIDILFPVTKGLENSTKESKPLEKSIGMI